LILNLKVEAESRAKSILKLFPGETMFSKTAYVTITTGLVSFLISKGIYIPNEETLVLISFLITVRALYNKLSKPISDYLENSINVRNHL
jgi:F-type H+-transporting ATPase subunit b